MTQAMFKNIAWVVYMTIPIELPKSVSKLDQSENLKNPTKNPIMKPDLDPARIF